MVICYSLTGANLDANDWKLLGLLEKLLEQPHEITLKLSRNDSTLSTVIPLLRCLQVEMSYFVPVRAVKKKHFQPTRRPPLLYPSY